MSHAATHNGYCQVCGREQAVVDGRIAKHGYEVARFGYFHGTCVGSGNFPLEVGRGLADKVEADLRRQAAAEREHGEDLKAGVENPLRCRLGEFLNVKTNRFEPRFVDFDQATPEQQAAERSRCVREQFRKAEQFLDYADGIRERADKITGKVALRDRAPAPKKRVLQVGDRVKVYGVEGVVVEIRSQVCRGCGPNLNGQYLPHAIVEREPGRQHAIPVRSIRTIL